jgi:NADH-quinone oxidoreductase subunit C
MPTNMPEENKGNDQPEAQPEQQKPAVEQPTSGEQKAAGTPAPGKSGDVAEGKDPAAVKPAATASDPAVKPTTPPADKAVVPGEKNPAAPMTPPSPAAAKPAAPAGAPAAAKPPAPPAKPAGPKPEPWNSDMVTRFKGHYGSGIQEAVTYMGQNYLAVDRSLIREVLQLMRDEEQFDYCVDITAVHYPKRELQFDIVYILYSFPRNERIRVKTQIPDGQSHPTAVPIWPTANWLERECFDMFGIQFEGHPDLRRILLPDGWNGYPLRKEYSILQQDTEWVKANLGIESGQ